MIINTVPPASTAEIYHFSVSVIDRLASEVSCQMLHCGHDAGAQAGIMRLVGLKAYLGAWADAQRIVDAVRQGCGACSGQSVCFATTFLDQISFEIGEIERPELCTIYFLPTAEPAFA